MVVLLIEIGNTHAKFADADLRLLEKIPTARLTPAAVRRIARSLGATECWVVSVVPAATRLVRDAFPGRVRLIRSRDVTGLTLSPTLPAPERIGVDRLLLVRGALALGLRAPLLAIDAGTACTFNVLAAGNVFLGGAIAPGASAFTDYLADRTARLPRLGPVPADGTIPAIGRDTAEAMRSAAAHGFAGMARGIVEAIRAELGVRRLPLILTGGASTRLLSAFPPSTRHDPLLVLRGLATCLA